MSTLKVVKVGIEVPEKIPEGLHAKCMVCDTIHKNEESIFWRNKGFKFRKQIKSIDSRTEGLFIGWQTKCANCNNDLFIPWKFKINGSPFEEEDQTVYIKEIEKE